MFLASSEQTADLLKGLGQIAHLMRLYKMREDLYLLKQTLPDFESAVIQLYSSILEHQARILCHLSKKSVTRAFQGIVKPSQWNDLMKEIDKRDKECLDIKNVIRELGEQEWEEEQTSLFQQSTLLQEDMVEAFKAMALEQATQRRDDEERQLLHAFSSRYAEGKDFNLRRAPGTCEWFLQNDKFRKWHAADTSVFLWASAGPGCGKSVLSRCLVDERLVSGRFLTSTVCYFFFKDGQAGRQTAANAVTAILHQIFDSPTTTDLISHALPRFRSHGSNLCGMFGELWGILVDVSQDSNAGEIVCVLDALDECEETERNKLIGKLVDFFSARAEQTKPDIRLKFLVTSREYDSIHSGFEELSEVASFVHFDASDQQELISRDISRVIDDRLPRVLGKKFDAAGQKQIADHLKAMEHRTYLWLHLMFDSIKRKLPSYGTAKKIQDLLRELPDSITAAYEEILQKSSDPQIARKALMLVLAAERPLTVTEMNVALGMVRCDTAESYEDLDLQEDGIFQDSLPKICGLFVSIHKSHVYLIHQTAREFLLKSCSTDVEARSCYDQPVWQHSIVSNDAEHLMARVCMCLLSFRQFRDATPWGAKFAAAMDHDAKFGQDKEFKKGQIGKKWRFRRWAAASGVPFLCYSALFWAEHFRRCQNIEHEELASFSNKALRLCQDVGSTRQVWLTLRLDGRGDEKGELGYDPPTLLLLAALDLHAPAKILLEYREEFPKLTQDEYSRALKTAFKFGHLTFVLFLLDQKVDYDTHEACEYGLVLAATRGFEDIVKVLLSKDVNPNTLGGPHCETALCAAASGGFIGIVRMLLDEHADVNVSDRCGTTPLLGASRWGHEDIVKVLLKEGADLNISDQFGTALQAASFKGHERIVRILLEYGADVNTQGGDYGTALREASFEGHEGIVRILLEYGARVDIRGGEAGTALQAASFMGHERIVRILLEYGADVNTQGGDYGTALREASFEGHEGIVRILLEYGARVDIRGGEAGILLRRVRNRQKRWTRRPQNLERAYSYGRIKQLLLQHGAVAEAEDDEDDEEDVDDISDWGEVDSARSDDSCEEDLGGDTGPHEHSKERPHILDI